MRRAIIAVLVLVGSSAQAVVLSIGLHQYVITDAGKQVFAKAQETCAKLGRVMMPLGVPSDEVGIPPRKQLKFECILAYEVAPNGQDTYRIHVPTGVMLGPSERMCPAPTCPIKNPPALLPDIGAASEQTQQLARTYCAKMHATSVVTGGGFDMGPGFTLIFKCVQPQEGAAANR
jgi:hypothetical protein